MKVSIRFGEPEELDVFDADLARGWLHLKDLHGLLDAIRQRHERPGRRDTDHGSLRLFLQMRKKRGDQTDRTEQVSGDDGFGVVDQPAMILNEYRILAICAELERHIWELN